jgi:D-alanine--poly(phosphoribitol) ligase subunit 2
MVREKVLKILCEICGTNEIDRNPDLEIFKEGLLDSFGTIEFFVALEEQLKIEIAPTEVDREMWATPNKIISYLEERIAS